MNYSTVLEFWFERLTPKDWWKKSDTLDVEIVRKFKVLHQQVAAGETVGWRESDDGRLAEIIVLDQFSRNMFRDQPGSFAYDQQAISLTRQAVAAGTAGRLDRQRVSFLLMPYMHSESLQDHDKGLPLFEQYCESGTVDFERRHRAIIQQFGRYPHRNKILGRSSSTEEQAFLEQPGSSF